MANTFATHILALAARGERAAEPASRSTSHSSQKPANTYAAAVLLMAMGGSAAHAATDGAVATGASGSKGQVGISLVIPERIEAKGLADLRYSPDQQGMIAGQSSACIAGHGSVSYQLGVQENSSASADHNGYTVEYSANGDAYQPLTMGQALAQLSGAGARGCAEGSANGRLALRIASGTSAGSARSRPAVLNLVIAPE